MKRRIYILLFICYFSMSGLRAQEIIVNVGDNLITAVADAADGSTIIIKPGIHKASYASIVIDNKSLTIAGEEGTEKPKVYISQIDLSGENVSLGIEGLEISGADVDSLTGEENTETLIADYFINLTDALVSGGDITVRDCIIRNLERAVLRGDRSTYHVENFTFDDCIITDLRGGGDYGPFRTKSNITFDTFTITNSTFYNILNELIDCQDIISYPMEILIENCTMFAWGGGKDGQYLFDIQNNDQASLKIKSCIFGKTNVDETTTVNGFRVINSAYQEILNCAFAPDFILSDSSYHKIEWDAREWIELDFNPAFEFPDTGNFTLPEGSPLQYMSPTGTTIGDPRWASVTSGINIKVEVKSLRLYPNPAIDKVFIWSDNSTAARIITILGQNVNTIDLIKGKNIIELNDLKPGIYYIVTEDKAYVNKLIVN